MNGLEAPECFDDACQRFAAFLHKNGYSGNVIWVDQNDIAWDKRQLWIRKYPAVRERASKRYSCGITAGHGIALYAFSITQGGDAVAAVILPTNDEAAQRYLLPPGGLKLSAAAKIRIARRVSNRALWIALSLLHRKSSRLFAADCMECA
jgi:hypothetical protein